MQGSGGGASQLAKISVLEARREAARALARLAAAAVGYADAAVRDARSQTGADRIGPGRGTPGEFVPDQLALLLREQPFGVRRMLARTRRLRTGLPTVWAAFGAGELDAEQVRVIDRVTRRVTEAHTRAAIDEQAVEAAQTRCPQQLGAWLVRLVVRLEPLAFAQRHRRALADRRVTVIQGVDGMGYVTGEVSAADAAHIDALLAGLARNLGAADPRTQQQRRADLFADLLLGRLHLVDDLTRDDNTGDEADSDDDCRAADTDGGGDLDVEGADDPGAGGNNHGADPGEENPGPADWLEVEDIDPDTGELLGTHWHPLDGTGEPAADTTGPPAPRRPGPRRSPRRSSAARRPRGSGSWCRCRASSASATPPPSWPTAPARSPPNRSGN